jgi:cardiolipin synthase
VKLILQPDDGAAPLLHAIRRAKRAIDIVIFRFDRPDLEQAVAAAAARGVIVRALIANTDGRGSKGLRKLEARLLAAGATVARSADDLPRYHAKMLLVDDVLHVLGFNYTKLDIGKSRSFGVATRDRRLVKEALALFEADRTRQPYSPGHERFVVSPESSRKCLMAFIRRARRELLIYDAKLTDRAVLRLLQERAKAGVAIRAIGRRAERLPGVEVRRIADLRLHVRAIVRDGAAAFVGSQSLRTLELDGRREVGLIVTDARIARKIRSVFEADWMRAGREKRVRDAEASEPTLFAAGA